MADYRQLAQRHHAEILERLPAFVARADWPPQQLKAERERLLRALVRTAKLKSPWHRQRLAGVDPDRLREEDLACLPVMTKADLMANYDDILTDSRLSLDLIEKHLNALTDDAYLLDQYHTIASGGSSGQRGVYVYSWAAWTTAWLAAMRLGARRPAANPPPRLTVAATVMAENAWHLSAALARGFKTPGVEGHNLPATLPLERIISELNRIQPHVLTAYPSILRLLVEEARAGTLKIAPTRVNSSSEPLLPEIRRDIETIWHAKVFNNYACSEMLGVGYACGEGDSMHVPDDILIIEPVDRAGNPVGPGVRSAKIYATNLFNPVLPLIRFEITDEVTLLDEPCPCGSTLRRLKAPQGRSDDGFTYAGGVRVHPLAFRNPLGHDRDVIEYQVRQTSRGADISIVAKGSVDLARLRDEVTRSLERAGLEQPEVSLTVVSDLKRTAAGKLRRFLPLA